MTTYVNSVQNVSITIPTGSTSATATISTVGSLAFIIWQGQNCNGSTNPNQGFARVTLTNSTTVTATRNTSNASVTVTVNCQVVDATSSLVKSVQYGTISFSAQGSSTATISSVTAANAVPQYLGFTTTNTTLTQQSNFLPVITLNNGTTVEGDVANSGTLIVSFCVIEFQSAVLNQAVQQIADQQTPSGNSRTVTLTSVNVDNTIVFYGGCFTSAASNATGLQRGALTNGTTFTISTNTGPGGTVVLQYNAVVVEFVSGVFAQSAQRGAITIPTTTSATATITALSSAGGVANYLGNITTQTSTLSSSYSDIVLTNATTITATTASSVRTITSWEGVDFTTGAPPAGSYVFISGFL